MEFSHLKVSIENNADQEPSIFTALCMVQSLFRDVENAANKDDISECSAEDEQLPSKLIWLSRTILEIYRMNLNSFQINRDRLDSVIEEVRSAEHHLNELNVDETKLQTLQNKLELYSSELETARERRNTCDALNGKIEDALTELESLRGFDPSSAEEELRTLSKEIENLTRDNLQLQQNLEQHRESKRLAANKQEGLINEITTVSIELEKVNSDLAKTMKEHKRTSDNKQLKEQELQNANAALGTLKEEIQDLTNIRIPAAIELRDTENREKNKLKEKLEHLLEESRKMQNEIARVKKLLPDQERQFNDTKQCYDELTGTYKARTTEIERMESKIRELEGLSVSEQLNAYENQLRQTLAVLEGTQSLCDEIRNQNQQKEKELENLRTLQTIHKEKNAELEGQIKELSDVAQPGYAQQLEELLNRLSILSQVRSELDDSVRMMRQLRGASPVTEDTPLKDIIKEEIEGLTAYANKLRDNLVRCSDSLNLEVKQ